MVCTQDRPSGNRGAPLNRTRVALYPDRLLKAELIPDFAELDDSEIVARAQELEAFDRAKLSSLGGAGGGAGGVCESGTGPSTEHDPPADGEVNELTRPFRCARPVLDAWADQAHGERDESQPGAWGGPEAALCRLLERAGPWRAASVLQWAWQRASGRPANAWCHERTGRIRVGPEPVMDVDEWVLVGDVDGRCGWPTAA
jgi:hypothetical protein